MKQGKLEEKVRELFEQQDFTVRKEGDVFVAENGQEIVLNIFSSEKFTEEEVVELVSKGKVFVDEDLSPVEEVVENPVSIIYEEDDEEYDMPSYELIGEIAVINELTVSEDEAVEGILEHHPSVKTILLKEEPLQGEYRVGKYKKLYGEETETIHKEYGCRFKVDPTKVYYSERFSTERKRVVDQIEEEEKVLVMFAGVGPFAIMASKLAKPEKVVAVEKNPEAAKYLKENIELNGVEETVDAYEGDVLDINYENSFDRVVMPLPGSADEFLRLAADVISDEGFIHYYRFLEGENWESLYDEVEKILADKEVNFEIEGSIVCGDRGPDASRVCLDIKIST